MHRRWLSWTVLSTTASAFYPYCPPTELDGGTNNKRFYPIQPQDNIDHGASFTLDVKKMPIPKRENTFPVIFSSKPDMPNAMAIDSDGQDYSYFSTMKFGSKQQPMYMLIDTGSANTWVFGSMCPSSACLAHNTFGPTDSTTLNVTNSTWSLTYGTGEVNGILASDTVAFANYSLTLGFGLAQTASDDFNYYPMDGILGLGRPSSNALGIPTVVEDLDSADLLRQNILGIHLQRSSSHDKDGQITFGGVDTTKFTGDLHYTNNLPQDSNWEIPVDQASVGGVACNFTGKSAIIDTGTSYILMPLQDALAVHALIPGSEHTTENFVVPCNTTLEVQFTFSGITYNVGSQDYIGGASGSMCASNIIGHQAFGPNQWILGDVFLKNVYTVFDFDNDRIGFGVKVETATFTTTSLPTGTSTSHPHTSTKASTVTATKSSSTATLTTKASNSATATLNSSPFDSPSSASTMEMYFSMRLMMLIAFLCCWLI